MAIKTVEFVLLYTSPSIDISAMATCLHVAARVVLQLPTYHNVTQLTSAFRRGLKTSFPSRLQLRIMHVVMTL